MRWFGSTLVLSSGEESWWGLVKLLEVWEDLDL
jgi:hypothetical protein